jgi:carboxymethylenebutenolidase
MTVELDQDLRGTFPDKRRNRREFIWTALGASAALAVGSNAGAQGITTDTEGLVAGDVEVPVRDGRLPAYRAMPASGGPFSVVLVSPEVFGNNPYIEDICRRLAKAGYYAIVPDLYARQGDLTRITDMARVMAIVNGKPDAELYSDFDATLAYARSTGNVAARRVGMVGFCRGGRNVWMYAWHNPKLDAAIAWYGVLDGTRSPLTPKYPLDIAGKVKVPVLGLYGAQDQGIPQEQVARLREALKAAKSRSEVIVYPDAGHAFNTDTRPDMYRKADAEDGWKRMLAWLDRHGVTARVNPPPR